MGVVVAQGAAFVAAGAAAEVVTPASVIAAGGGIGAVMAVGLTFCWRRVTSPRQPHRPAERRLPGGRPARWEPGDPPPAEVMVSPGAGEYLRDFTAEDRYPRAGTRLLTRPGRKAVLERNGLP
jgi:hypothetical protein